MEWIKKLWYIYTMEYYSAITRNTFELVLVMNLFAGQQWRRRHREQTCRHSGGRRGGDALREEHGNIHITTCQTDSPWEFAV